MKKMIIVIICVLGLYGCGQKRPAVIERPVFDVANTVMIEINKIEISDSATVFHMDAFVRPVGWIAIDPKTYIRESGSDEKLIVFHSEGININERTYMPDSGNLSFKLFFPPLRPEVTKIDYIEDYPDGGWKILGIQLLPKSKITFDPIVQKVAKIPLEPLPALEYSLQPAKVSGRMLGYADGMYPAEITVYASNFINGERIEAKFPIADDGSFGGEIVTGVAGIYRSSAGNLFLIPGKEVKIYIDLKKRSRLLSRYRTDKEPGDSIFTYVAGSCFTTAELENIHQAPRNLLNYQKLMPETVNMNPEQFKQYLLEMMNKRLDEIRQSGHSDNMKMMMENNIKLTVYTFLMQYESFINSAYMRVNNIQREDRDKVTFKAEKPGMEYYSFLRGELNDNMSFFPNFPYLAEMISRVEFFNLPDDREKPVKERFAYFKEKFVPILGTDQSILFDVIQAQFYGQQVKDMKFFTDAEKQELREVFKDKPAFAEALIAENDKMVALIAANKENKECVAHDPPKVSQEKMFDAIIAKYRGKVVVVDFWATWCGPCMQAMKSIKPLKDEMKGKDVVWLYLTGETSPLNTWLQTYPAISGEHYRVSEAQWGYWYKTYGIEGIPTYIVYDRRGKQLSKYTGFPGVDAMKKDIEKGY